VVTGREQPRVDDVVSAILQRGGRAMGIAAEISNRQQVEHLFRQCCLNTDVWTSWSTMLVSTAVPFMELTEEEWDRVLQTNLKGTFYCLKAVIPQWYSRSGSCHQHRLCCGQNGGRLPVHHYIASKSAIVGLTKSLSAEFAPQGLRINCVCPASSILTWAPVSRRSLSK